jgi:hypothetical protein
MLNGALKCRAITPTFHHAAFNLRTVGLAVELDELSNMRHYIKKEWVGTSDHSTVNAHSAIACSTCDAFQRRLS